VKVRGDKRGRLRFIIQMKTKKKKEIKPENSVDLIEVPAF